MVGTAFAFYIIEIVMFPLLGLLLVVDYAPVYFLLKWDVVNFKNPSYPAVPARVVFLLENILGL